MSLLRPISIFLRNTLVKQHPYFSCCASCGEIKTPLESRLCSSLSFPFAVDAVVMDSDEPVAALERHCSWLRRIFIVSDGKTARSGIPRTEQIISVHPADFTPPGSCHGPRAHCQDIPGISDYFLIVPRTSHPERDLLPLDFFTPNGIPLLRLKKAEDGADIVSGYGLASGILAQTRENAAAFLEYAGKNLPAGIDDYPAVSARWAFSTGKTIPAREG